jgi:hypothetical protein
MSWESGGGGWSGEGDKKPKRERTRKPAKNETAPDSSSPDAWGEAGRVKSAKRRKSVVLYGASGLLVAGVVLTALVPTIAGVLAPGVVSGAVSDSIPGRAEVGGVRLGWFGSQRVRGFELFDPDGSRVAFADVEIDTGFLGLVTAGLDLGEVTVRGGADIVRDDEGVTNVERALGVGAAARPGTTGRSGSGDTGSGGLPAGLHVDLDLAEFNATYTDPALAGLSGDAVGFVKISGLSGSAKLETGEPVDLRLRAEVRTGASGATSDDLAGEVEISVRAERLVGADGTVDLAGARVTASVEASAIAIGVIDAIAGRDGALLEALGERATLTGEASGTLGALEVSATLRAEDIEAIAAVTYQGELGRVESAGPIRVTGDTARLVALVPGGNEALNARAGVDVSAWPALEVNVENLRFTIPDDQGLDLRGSGVVVRVNLGALAASVPAPAAGDEGQTAQARRPVASDRWAVAVDPLVLEIEARDLAGEIDVRTETAVRVDDEPAGRLAVNMTISDLLDGAGAVRVDSVPRLGGSLAATGLALGVVEPLLAGSGIMVTRDIGPDLDLTVYANAGDNATQAIDVSAVAKNLRINGGLLIAQNRVELTDEGMAIELSDTGPLVRRLSGAVGADIDSGGDVTVTLTRFDADTAGLLRGDLGGVAMGGSIGVSETIGRVRTIVPGEREAGVRRRVALRDMEITVQSDGLGSGVRLGLGGSARIDNEDAGRLEGDLFVAGILDDEGRFVAGVPGSLSGNVTLDGVSTAVLQPFVTDAGLVLSQDLGERVDLRLRARGVAATTTRRNAPTRLTLTAESEIADIRADLELRPDAIRTRGDGVRFEHTGPGHTGARLAGLIEEGGPISVAQAGGVVFTLTDLVVPVDPSTRAVDVDRAEGAFELELTGVELHRTVEGPAAGTNVRIGSLRLDGSIAPGRGLSAESVGAFNSGGVDFGLEGRVRLPTLTGDIAGTAQGELTLQRVPVGLADFLPTSAQTGAPLSATLRDLLGPIVSASVTSRPGDDAHRSASIRVNSRGLRVDGSAEFERGTDQTRLSNLDVRGTAALVPASVSRLLALADVRAPDGGPAPLVLREPGTTEFTLGLNDAGNRVELRSDAPGLAFDGLPELLGLPGDIGGVTAGLGVVASAPVRTVMGDPAGAGQATVAVRLGLRDDTGAPVGQLSVNATAPLRGTSPAGTATVKGSLNSLRTAWLDRMLDDPGLLAGALGDEIAVRVDGTAEMGPVGVGEVAVVIEPTSARVRTREPIRVTVRDEALTLAEPFELTWDMRPRWATERLGGTLPPETEGGENRPIVTFRNAVGWTVRGNSLRVPLGERVRTSPELSLDINSGGIRTTMLDGSDRVYPGSAVSLRTIDDRGTVAINAELAGPGSTRAAYFDGRAQGLVASASGPCRPGRHR